ncbi:DUF1294 domain-containing protein [Bacteroides fragilis]|nr:DUF1294 domain-containing protein [Bacteroides fragilis]MCS2358917.1 DUF1294 domain-containing protein [Bacteroides fragilis]
MAYSRSPPVGNSRSGGSLGAWARIYTFRHKTRHLKFKYGIPVIGVLQVGTAICLLLSEFT